MEEERRDLLDALTTPDLCPAVDVRGLGLAAAAWGGLSGDALDLWKRVDPDCEYLSDIPGALDAAFGAFRRVEVLAELRAEGESDPDVLGDDPLGNARAVAEALRPDTEDLAVAAYRIAERERTPSPEILEMLCGDAWGLTVGRAAAAMGPLSGDRFDIWKRIDPDGELLARRCGGEFASKLDDVHMHLGSAAEEFYRVRMIAEFPGLFDLPDRDEVGILGDDPVENAEAIVVSEDHLTVPNRHAAAVAYRIADES